MNGIRGVICCLPFTGTMLLLGVFALTGFPPFCVFFSEIVILIAAFIKGSYLAAGLLLFFLVIIFGAFIYHFSKILFGKMPKDFVRSGEPLSGKIASLFLFLLVCTAGIGMLLIKNDLTWVITKLFLK